MEERVDYRHIYFQNFNGVGSKRGDSLILLANRHKYWCPHF